VNSDQVKISGRFTLAKESSGSPVQVSIADAERVVDQWQEDALTGSFAPVADIYDDNEWETPKDQLAITKSVDHQRGSDDSFRFEIGLNLKYFPLGDGGLQHLIGIVAGDLFIARFSDLKVTDFQITELEHPDLSGQLEQGTVATVRKNFGLHANQPLLAFSFKPRVGLKPSSMERVVLGVLSAGFNIVEMDTRQIILDSEHCDWLVELSKKAIKQGKAHITRFSPNLTMSAALVVDTAKKFQEAHDGLPWVVKVDGGLDGISTVQALRKQWPRSEGGGLTITSYPYLRNILSSRVPGDFMNHVLAAAGIDILYAGQRPSFSSTTRQLDASASLHNSIRRYQAMYRSGYFIPTIAGGIKLGEIHAYIDLLWPNSAFFLGGCIAAHKNGAIEGAEVCVRVVEEAIKDRKKPEKKRKRHLSKSLIIEIESSYINHHQYISPRDSREKDGILNSLCRD